MPVDDAHPELYGSGYINGTIIGIPKNGKHTAQAWALVRYLTTNDHALAELSNGLRNVPTTTASANSKEIKPDAHFATFIKVFSEPEVDHVADHRVRRLVHEPRAELRDAVAGRPGEGSAVRADLARQAARRSRRSRQRGRSAVSHSSVAGERPRRGRVDGRSPTSQEKCGVAAAADSCSCFMSPWLVGFAHLLRVPARDERVPVVQPLRPALAAALGRLGELPLPLPRGPAGLDGGEEHDLADRSCSCRCRCCSRSDSRVMLDARAARRRRVPHVFYLPALAPPVAATLGFVYILNPVTGPVNMILGAPRHPGAALVPGPALGEAVARRARALGRRQR